MNVFGILGRKQKEDLAEEGLLVGEFILEFVVQVVNRRCFSLSCQVAFLQCRYPLLHVILLSERLDNRSITESTSTNRGFKYQPRRGSKYGTYSFIY